MFNFFGYFSHLFSARRNLMTALFTPLITLPRHFDETLNMREKICSATEH
jgi:hypothetical protein